MFETAIMVVPAEDPVAIGMDGFVNSVAVKKPMIIYGNPRLIFIEKATVEENLHDLRRVSG